MKFLLDSCISSFAVRDLRDAGFDVLWIPEIGNMINKTVKNKAGVKFSQKRKWDTKSRLLASVDKARELIGYEPKVEFKEGLFKTIKWFKDNWKNIEKSASFPPGISSAVRDK